MFDFNMTEWLGKQTMDFCESFVQLSKQCLSRDCQNNVSFVKMYFQFGLASMLTQVFLFFVFFPEGEKYPGMVTSL